MWLARENDERLLLFMDKPFRQTEYFDYKDTDYWWSTANSDDDGYYLYNDMYPEVTFQNSPVEVELKLKL